MGSNISSRPQNLISTVQIVATWVSNLFSKFQLNRTIDEVITAHWWNLGSEMRFFSLFLLFSLFFFPIPFFFFNATDLVPKHMGPSSDYVRGFTKPTCFLQNCSFSVNIGFVIIFDPFSSIWIFSRQNNFISSASRIQMIYHINMLGSRVKSWILTEMNSTLTITVE